MLYPPYLNGTLPAFAGTILKIPFEHSPAVSANSYDGFSIKFKEVNVDTELFVLEIDKSVENNGVLNINLEDNIRQLISGTFYKIQIAYAKNNEIGIYSNVGVIKYTNEPTLEIGTTPDFDLNNITLTNQFMIRYSSVDREEKLYSSSFEITTMAGNSFYKSEEKLHNSFNDNEDSTDKIVQYETFNMYKLLKEGQGYYLKITATTTNGLIIESSKIVQGETGFYINSEAISLVATNDFDNGRIRLKITPNQKLFTQGSLKIYRTSSKTNFEDYYEMGSILVNGEKTWYDYNIEQGIIYQYAIKVYNKKKDSGNIIYSTKIEGNQVMADFDAMFLFDGKKQLKLAFNPKVSSFKTTKLETKQDTLGGTYPIFYRNGNTNYKEFSINALLSYLADENELFLSNEEMRFAQDTQSRNATPTVTTAFKNNYRTTDLTSNNIFAERKFKLEVLDWLNNGQTKLFKSSTEGTYLVKLMNVSLSPEDQLGRMLHNIQATAYEVANFDYSNVINYHLLLEEDNEKMLNAYSQKITSTGEVNLLDDVVYGLEFSNFMPGDVVEFTVQNNINPTLIIIPPSGSYKITNSSIAITNVNVQSLNNKNEDIPFISYLYYGVKDSSVRLINDSLEIFVNDISSINTYQSLETIIEENNEFDLIKHFEKSKNTYNVLTYIYLQNILYLKFEQKDSSNIEYGINDYLVKFYLNKDDEIPAVELNIFSVGFEEYFNNLQYKKIIVGKGVRVNGIFVVSEIKSGNFVITNDLISFKKAIQDSNILSVVLGADIQYNDVLIIPKNKNLYLNGHNLFVTDIFNNGSLIKSDGAVIASVYQETDFIQKNTELIDSFNLQANIVLTDNLTINNNLIIEDYYTIDLHGFILNVGKTLTVKGFIIDSSTSSEEENSIGLLTASQYNCINTGRNNPANLEAVIGAYQPLYNKQLGGYQFYYISSLLRTVAKLNDENKLEFKCLFQFKNKNAWTLIKNDSKLRVIEEIFISESQSEDADWRKYEILFNDELIKNYAIEIINDPSSYHALRFESDMEIFNKYIKTSLYLTNSNDFNYINRSLKHANEPVYIERQVGDLDE